MTVTTLETERRRPQPDHEGRSFIEVQFPVSRLSKESFKEQDAKRGRTLTALGKWWGRKPLVLVRAIILGLLMPATDDPEADRETFLALMTMDDDGLTRRLDGAIPAAVVHRYLAPSERERAFALDGDNPRWRSGLSREDRRRYQFRALRAMNYDDRLNYVVRPEHLDGPSAAAWGRINAHLGTSATSIPELVAELGERRFGAVPDVGDAFCGGGSIPFEAARIGCNAYASDLNPIAGLLTRGALEITGGGDEAAARVGAAQRRVFEDVRRQVEDWGIERNEEGWIADAYLYCAEVRDPASGWLVPLAPSWQIAPKTRVGARLIADSLGKRFDIEIVERLSEAEFQQTGLEGTAANGVRSPVDRNGNWLPVHQRTTVSMDQIRGRGGLRRWASDDVIPRPDDVLQERLYCIRWFDPVTGQRHYRAPTAADMQRELRVLDLLRERFGDWHEQGYIPSRAIETGDKTDEPIRTRGWTHWHHLFNPRQLLLNGLIAERAAQEPPIEAAAMLLFIARNANWNSKLCSWKTGQGGGIGGGMQAFYNQALNTFANYSCRPLATLESAFVAGVASAPVVGPHTVELGDARTIDHHAHIWITDPGYGDMILYDELSEFFLAWLEKSLPRHFSDWYADSKRALNVRGEGETFRLALAACYTNLANQMPENGFQVVMFTHKDPEVWADVALTLWAAGLEVSAAWTIQTETPSTGVKGGGNYVTGTVILVLRKRQGDRRGDLSDLYPEIQAEVKRQIEEMTRLDDRDEPNFGDADYQLAAYAAALRVLKVYAAIDEIDVQKELRRERARGEVSPLAALIGQAVRIASDHLVPAGLDRAVWRKLGPEERLYLKGIQVEASGEAREGVYQELARGYGAGAHRELYASRSANRVRFKTATELGARDLRRLGEPEFPGSTVRHLLYAVSLVAADPERDPRAARTYLRQEIPAYWDSRLTLADLLRFLADTAEPLEHWRGDVEAARLLESSLRHDAV